MHVNKIRKLKLRNSEPKYKYQISSYAHFCANKYFSFELRQVEVQKGIFFPLTL